ncbi:MAG: hypothetical protein RLZZ597_1452 [Cyanobacteriota bacterium]|jgi:hypothetical protein
MIAPMPLLRSFSSPLRWLTLAPRTISRAGVVVACLVAVGLGLEAQAHGDALDRALLAPEAPVLAQAAPARPFPAPGQYLFGQSAQPDQWGHGYIVLESDGQAIYGALYFPGSSFDCFQGRVEGNALAMTIIDSYSQEAYPYSIALEPQSALATESGSTTVPLNLSGFYSLDTLTENDLRMLNVCKPEVAPAL